MWGCRKVSICKLGRELPPETSPERLCSWTSGFQDCEKLSFCCLSCLIYSNLLWQTKQTNTESLFLFIAVFNMILSCLTCYLHYIWCLWTYCLVSERLNLEFSAEERKGYVPVCAECGDGHGELSAISKYFWQILLFQPTLYLSIRVATQFVLVLFCFFPPAWVILFLEILLQSFSTVVSCPASFLVWGDIWRFKCSDCFLTVVFLTVILMGSVVGTEPTPLWTWSILSV